MERGRILRAMRILVESLRIRDDRMWGAIPSRFAAVKPRTRGWDQGVLGGIVLIPHKRRTL